MQKKTYLTAEQLERLKEEMRLIRQSSRIEGAIEEGGTTDDAEYDESENIRKQLIFSRESYPFAGTHSI